MLSYREKFKIVEDEIPTQWSEKFEEDYYNYFSNHYLVKSNMKYYIKDIKNRLKL